MNSLMTLSEALADAEVFTDGDWVESKDQDPAGDVRLTQLADVGDGHWIDKSARFLTSTKAAELKCTYLQQGDLLVARMPDPLGRCCEFPGSPIPCVTVVDVCVIRPNHTKVVPRYLMHAINSPLGRRGIGRHVTGTTRKRISRKNLAKIQIPLPPLAEQERIAGILDAADALRAQRREALAQLDTLLQSTFLDMFGDPATNPMQWERCEFGDHIEHLGDYHSNGSYKILKEHVELKSSADFALMIRTTDLETGTFDESNKYISQDAYNFLERSKVFGGEIIINKIGSAGKVYLMPFLNRPVSLGMNAFLIRTKSPVNNLFAYFYLKSTFGEKEIKKRVKGAVTKTIRKDAVREIPFFWPSNETQEFFASIVESVEQQKARMRTHLEELDTLFASLQSRAFNGELGIGTEGQQELEGMLG